MRYNLVKPPMSALCCLLAGLSLLLGDFAQAASVATLGGGDPNVSPKYQGYRNGTTLTQALFRNPCGLAIDKTGNYLLVADRDNNTVRLVDFTFTPSITATLLTMTNYVPTTNLFSKPVGVAIDLSYNIFVLNRGNGTNGYVLQFDVNGELIATNLNKITNAAGMAVDFNTNIFVTASNRVFKYSVTTGVKTQIAQITASNCSLQGITVKRDGQLAVCDAGRNGILFINPNTGVVTTNAGFHGKGDFITVNNSSISNTAKFFQPYGVAETGDGTLIVSDFGNHRLKAVLTSGAVTNISGVASNYWGGTFPGWYDGTVFLPDTIAPNAQSRQPNGIAYAYDGSIYVSEDFYHTIRKITGTGLALLPPPPQPAPTAPINLAVTTNFGTVTITWTAVSGATNYNVKRANSTGGPYTTIGSTINTSYTDNTVVNGTTYYYVVSALGSGGESLNSAEIMAKPPTPPPPAPRIGWFDYEGDFQLGFFTKLYPVTITTLNNDAMLAIETTDNVSTRFIAGAPNDPLMQTNPSATYGSTPPFYKDNLGFAQPLQVTAMPDLLIKAVNVDSLGQRSAVTTAEFLFQVASPTILGNNAAQFTVSDLTTNAVLWYTTDGSDPTNAAPSIGPISSGSNQPVTLSINVTTNVIFKVRAFRNGYTPSGIAVQQFSLISFNPNTISFGFASGEASSDFVASPGQTFYAPITLSLIGAPTINSLQFNLIVTNGVTNSGPPITVNNFGFQSMLEKPIPGITPTLYERIIPAMFTAGASVPNPVNIDGSTNFSSLLTTNSGLNLLGVGWLERVGATNLYNTGNQTLVTFSQAHDTLFLSSGGKVIVGGLNISIPVAAQTNNSYKILIGRPSATSDGIGAAGSDVFISAPTNLGTAGGTVNALKYITVGQRKYVAGSVYPFRWFNAGDFGSSNLVSADVAQVFQSAIYSLNYPPAGSDFFDAMDSCGSYGALCSDAGNVNFGNYTNSFSFVSPTDPLFDGNDATINQVAFGDGSLDICDVYVTYRRSLDPSTTFFRRFWNNGARVADTTPNVAAHVATKSVVAISGTIAPKVVSTVAPLVNFAAGDVVGSAGSVVQIPITANILGSYPLRTLMLNVTVVPLDGSPAITTAVSFTQTSTVIGSPYTTSSKGYGNYAAVWLNTTNAGLTGSITIGTLNVTIPASAGTNAAYAVHFDHISASPNGLATFPQNTLTGVLATRTRTNSTSGDGIPDSWRLRWFGTLNNALAASNACPSGDGINNYKKFVAGVDPNAANNFPSVKTKSAVTPGYSASIHWPSVNGKKYAIERSATLFNGSWSVLNTNTGTGNDMTYDDATTNKVKFYRVRILP